MLHIIANTKDMNSTAFTNVTASKGGIIIQSTNNFLI